MVAGGEVFSPDQALMSVELLDPGDEQWATIDPLPHGLHGNPLVAIDTAVYLPGGSIRRGSRGQRRPDIPAVAGVTFERRRRVSSPPCHISNSLWR